MQNREGRPGQSFHMQCIVSFRFLPKEGGGGGGGQNEIVWIIGGEGGKYVSVCKTWGKLGGPGACSPGEILFFDLLLGAIWWNLGLFFAQVQFTIYCVIKAFINP